MDRMVGSPRIGRPAVLAAGVATLALVALAATPQLLGSRVVDAVEGLRAADPRWLWLAALGFLASLVGSAGGWRAAVGLCGGRIGMLDANARYGVGSLVNTFVPARAGDAVRIALFARTLDHPDRLWTMGGAFAAIGAARAVALAVLVICGAAVGAVPLWPLVILLALVGAAVAVAWRARNCRARTHAAHVLDAFRALGREPLGGVVIVGWILFATLGRLASAAAIAAALGVPHPLTAAIVIVPALDLAGQLPLTPGNIGVTSGAVAMALQAHGIGWSAALSAGIAFHAVETVVGVGYGAAGLLVLGGGSLTGTRRALALGAAATACLALGAVFSATVLAPLV
jgi:uncharacterized membrane protein YbhN (UPF0104 family)